MRKEKGITIVALVITIIILIILAGVSMNEIIGDNGIIKETKQQRENIETQQREEQIKLNELKETLGSEAEQGTEKDIIEQLEKTTVTEEKMLKGYTAYSGGQLITGTMTNNGAVSSTLNCGASYTIPAGYHNGTGKVTANSLASQTSATATAADILSGKTAWVNGNKITGEGEIANSVTFTLVGYTSGSPNYWTSEIKSMDISQFNTLTLGTLSGADAHNSAGVITIQADDTTLLSESASGDITLDISEYSELWIIMQGRYEKTMSIPITLSK